MYGRSTAAPHLGRSPNSREPAQGFLPVAAVNFATRAKHASWSQAECCTGLMSNACANLRAPLSS
jgi:hypothetical protein